MKKLISIIVMIVCLGVSGQINAQCTDRPIINDFSPKTGFIGSTVTITGANFNATPANNQVFFGATEATIVSSSFGTLEVRVPEGSTTALISVKNHCNLTAYSKTHFNGVFCPTPLTSNSYQNVSQELNGIFGAYNMLSQDMDNDGKPEVISARNGGGITIAINNSTPGTINFASYNNGSTGGAAQSIAIADFDGDGLKDIVTNSAIMRNISTGIGNIGLQYITNSRGVSSYQVAAGDFNNDGKIDIIGENGNNAWVAFNISTGPGNINFTSRQLVKFVGSRCTGIQVADLDGDGKADFVASQGGANRAVSIRNTTSNGSLTASFENPEYWNSGGTFPYRAMIADFDKDGRIDFTSCNYLGTTNVAIWRNTSTVGDISFATTVNFSSPTRNYRIGVGDVDGDGYPDVVTKSLGINVFSVYRNTSSAPGTITFANRFDYNSSSRAEVSGIVIGDLDGDFVPDIATSGISSNSIRFHRNTGAQNDITAPTAVCRNITVALSPNGTVSITPEMIDNGSGDACGIESLTLSISDFTCADIGENTVTLTATDGAGNSASCTATVNVQPAAIIVAGQSTVCQGETVVMNANDGDSYQWKKDGTDIAGATNQNYIATTTGDYTVIVTNAGGCSGESLETPVVVNENPTVDISPSGNAFLCPPNGSTTLTATQSSIYQWMKDGVDIANATQQTYEATMVGNYSVRVIDLFGCSAVSDETVITANPAEIVVSGNGNYGNVFPNQSYTQTITISNTGTGNLDITNLMVSGPDASSFTLVGFSSPGTISPGSSASLDVVFNAPNITTYAALLNFNSNDCDEGFISLPLNAEITCEAANFGAFPSNISSNTDPELCSANVDYNVEALGNPTSTLTYSFTGDTTANGNGSGTGSTFNVGTTTVTINVSNACGDETQSFDVIIEDNEAPVINGSGGSTILTDPNGNGVFNSSDVTTSPLTASPSTFGTLGWFNSGGLRCFGNASAGYSGSPTFDGLFNVNASGTFSTAMTFSNGDIINNSTGSTGWGVISYLGSGTFNVGFRTISNHYGYMNITQDSSGITINNMVINPEVGTGIIVGSTGVGNVTVNTDANECGAIVTHNLTASDNCAAALSYSHDSGSLFAVGTTTVTAIATDASGNTTTTTFDVTVNDNVAPNVITQDISVDLDVNGQASISVVDINNGTNDACGIESLALDITSFDCSNVGENTVILSATDVNGNISSNQAIVTVIDNTMPTVMTQNVTIDLDSGGNASIAIMDIDNGSFDNCSFTLELDTTTFDCNNVGENTVTLTGTDASGNETTQSATVTVRDLIAPTVITQSATVTLANGEATITPQDVDGGTFDNCTFDLTLDNNSFSCNDIGENTVTLTATDASGNSTSETATVTVVGDIPTVSIDDFTAVNNQNTNTVYLGYGPQNITLNTNTSGGNGFTYDWSSNSGEIIDNVATPNVSPTVSTIYTVIVTNSNGCISDAATIEICVIDARAFDKKGRYKGKVNVCHHTNGKKGTKHVNISISQNAVASHLQHGLGTSHPDSLGGCGAVCVDNTNARSNTKTSITTSSLIENLSIYPNPSNGIFDVRLTTIGLETNVLLFDATGKLIERKFFNKEDSAENIITIGNHNLASGIYILKVITNNETVSKKLIITKD